MKLQVEGTRAVLRFVPPRLNPLVLGLARVLVPGYLRSALHLRMQEPGNIDTILHEYQHFFQEESKLILVFRHVHVHDAQVMFYLFNTVVHTQAKKKGIRYPYRPHAHFLYGRGVPLWGGAYLEWLFSRLGGIPVHHRKLDRQGLDAVRRHMAEGRYPIALAPEGQVTYHNQVVHDIEPGFAQLAMWARHDVEQAGQTQDVRILPISQFYDYGEDGMQIRGELVDKISRELGIDFSAQLRQSGGIRPVLWNIGIQLLSKIETFYADYYQVDFSDRDSGSEYKHECTRQRVEQLVDGLLKMQEQRLGIHHPPKGFTPRIYIVRLAGWNRIFVRENNSQPTEQQKAPLDRELQDYIAAEAGLFARHLEVVDLLAYLQPEYALESDDANRHIEFLLNLLDAVNRLKGGTIGQRMHPRSCTVKLNIGTPISMEHLSARKAELSNRQLRKELVERVREQFSRLAGD
ncbi:MAG: 1-acyl-sn-glycerol-3-phosphate acyltransferase [Spirochaetia bacterium]